MQVDLLVHLELYWELSAEAIIIFAGELSTRMEGNHEVPARW